MAKKLYFSKEASTAGVAVQGGTGGMAILLLFIPVIAFIFYSKRKGGKSVEELTDEQKKAKAAKKKEEEDKKKAEEAAKKKKAKKSNIAHANPAREALVDEKWEAIKAANPNNPFYQAQPMPEGWLGENQKVNPIYKTTDEERAAKKGVHKPYKEGHILPYDSRTENRIKFITEEDKEPVDGLALIDPFSYIPEKRPVSEFNHRLYEGTYKGPSQNRGNGPQLGSRNYGTMPLAKNKERFIELTKSLGEVPVSMPEEDVKILLAAVEVATANPDPNSMAFKVAMGECWHDRQGTYPIFVTGPLALIEKSIKDAWPEFFARLDKYQKVDKRGQVVKTFQVILQNHMGYESKSQVQEPKVLILLWFLEHFRLWGRKERVFVSDDGSDFENPPTDKLKAAYRLMMWVEVLAQSCAQVWMLSPRGFDLPGLVIRYHNQPLPRPFINGNRTFDKAAAIFLPSHSKLETGTYKEWMTRASAARKGPVPVVATVTQNTSEAYNDMSGVKVPDPFRSLTFRPGWSVGAVLKTGDLENAFEPGAEASGYVNDGRMFVHEWEKGVEARPGSSRMYDLFIALYVLVEPQIIRFRKRAQYSWSPTLTQESAGFVEGQISMCLGSLSTELAKSRNVRSGHWETDDHSNRPTWPNYIDFGDNIPLQYELTDGAKIYSFPSLRDFHALQRIYLPYVSLVPDAADRTPEKSPECTATLALHDSLDLYKQLDERRGNVILVVICRDGKDPVNGVYHTAEEWCGRLELELRLEAKKLNRAYEDYRDLIKWTKDDGIPPDKKYWMNLVQGDASMWHV